MIYGLISDIHANLEAFEAVLAELAGVEAFVCLGDIVGYGPDPGACVERVRGLPHLTCIAGNHDLAAIGQYDLAWFNPHAREAIEWTAEQLSADQKEFLASLQPKAEVGGAVIAHGSLAEPMAYITSIEEAMVCFEKMTGALCFVGHTHVAEQYRNRAGTEFCDHMPLWDGGAVEVKPELRYIINPGAIGQPRDGNPKASFGVWEGDAGRVEVRRVEYDIAAVQEKMKREGLPEYLVERLARGR
jgi:diadenosine tetraphosphatase ApaH/serine/threonine PP2A family protein phosphatase